MIRQFKGFLSDSDRHDVIGFINNMPDIEMV